MGLHERINSERAWSKGPGIQDGADVERAILGKAVLQEEHGEYLPFDEAIAFAKEHQPGLLGRSETVRKLREKVAAYCASKKEPVRFFTAVGTPLDLYHGIDAFFEQGDRRATVDVSMREKESYKADVLLFATMDDKGAIVVDEKELAAAAAKIAAKLDVARH